MKYSYSLLFIFLIGCNPTSDLKKKLIGSWVIDSISGNQVNSVLDLTVNVMNFDKNGSCSIPQLRDSASFSTFAKWDVLIKGKEQYFNIYSENFLNGKYSLKMKEDINGEYLKIELESNQKRLAGTKQFYGL
jgi:hypothetical protein